MQSLSHFQTDNNPVNFLYVPVSPKCEPNGEVPDETPLIASSGSTLFAKTNDVQRKECSFYLDMITFDPSINTMDHPKLIVSNQKAWSVSA